MKPILRNLIGFLVCCVLIIAVGIWTGGIKPSSVRVANALTRPASEGAERVVVQDKGRVLTLGHVNEKVEMLTRIMETLQDRVAELEGASRATTVVREVCEVGCGETFEGDYSTLESEIFLVRDEVEEIRGVLDLLEEDVYTSLGWIDEMYAAICYSDLPELSEASMCD